MFVYKSEKVHSTMKNGKGVTRINRIDIKNNKGTREMVTKNMTGKTLRKKRKTLKRKDIQTIQKRQMSTPFGWLAPLRPGVTGANGLKPFI